MLATAAAPAAEAVIGSVRAPAMRYNARLFYLR